MSRTLSPIFIMRVMVKVARMQRHIVQNERGGEGYSGLCGRGGE